MGKVCRAGWNKGEISVWRPLVGRMWDKKEGFGAGKDGLDGGGLEEDEERGIFEVWMAEEMEDVWAVGLERQVMKGEGGVGGDWSGFDEMAVRGVHCD